MQQIKILNNTYKVEDHWFWNQYNQETWEPETLEVYKQYLTPSTNYIDIGAWLGVTIFYAKELGCENIYGVEANPISYELLKSNCNLNNIDAQLDKLCICDTNSLVPFGSTNENITSSNSSMRGDKFIVQGIRLRDYLRDKPKDNLFIKIDIEGAEELLLDDLRDVKSIIYLSIHVPFLNDKKKFLKKLQKFKTSCNNLEERILSEIEHPEWGTSFGNFFEIIIDNE